MRLLKFKRFNLFYDPYLLLSIILLSIIGLIVLFSASQGNTNIIVKQSIFVFLGIILMIGGNIEGETRVLSLALFDHVEAFEYSQAHWLAGSLLIGSMILLALVYLLNYKKSSTIKMATSNTNTQTNTQSNTQRNTQIKNKSSHS